MLCEGVDGASKAGGCATAGVGTAIDDAFVGVRVTGAWTTGAGGASMVKVIGVNITTGDGCTTGAGGASTREGVGAVTAAGTADV